MKKYNPLPNAKPGFVVLLILLVLCSIVIITTQHHDRLNGDSIVRISIAEKYIRGDFSNAVNGFYGPLFSWILIPFLVLGSSHLFAINAFCLIVGLLTVIGVWMLSYRFELTERIRSIILVPLLPIVLSSLLIQPIDVLFTCILVFYLYIVFKPDYSRSIYNGISGGTLGALAYFAKAYAFPFFLAHFLLVNICQYLGSSSIVEKKNILRNAAAGLILFLIISAPWIALISSKYNRITFSTSGGFAYNMPEPGPDGKSGIMYEKVFDGFRKPFNETAIVAWEDPTYYHLKPWHPLQSRSHFKYFIKTMTVNISRVIYIFESFSSLSIAIIIFCALFFLVRPFDKQILRNSVVLSMLSMILYTGGHIPFHIELRHLWIVNILLLLMGGFALNEFFSLDFFRNNGLRRNILIIFFILSFIILPLKIIKRVSHYNIDTEMYYLSKKLKKYGMHGNFASSRDHITHHPYKAWNKTFLLAYHLKSKSYGQPPEDISDSDLEKELLKYDIDYYFLWGGPENMPQFLSKYKELTDGGITDLKIYSLKEKNN